MGEDALGLLSSDWKLVSCQDCLVHPGQKRSLAPWYLWWRVRDDQDPFQQERTFCVAPKVSANENGGYQGSQKGDKHSKDCAKTKEDWWSGSSSKSTLPSKHEALNLNPSKAKKQKTKKMHVRGP
jgi:hypothetical protein